MAAFNGEFALFTYDGDASVAALALARKMLGTLNEGSVQISQMYRMLGDGTIVIAQRIGSLYRAIVQNPTATTRSSSLLSNVWWPRGFVIYPAWHANPFGVGLPIVQDGTGAQSPSNTAPGLDSSRWTPGGPCGEVLLTRDSNAGYPNPGLVTAPLFYDSSNGVPVIWTGLENYDSRSFAGGWGTYRLEIAPFQARGAGENAAALQSTFTAVNTARTNAGRPSVTQLFRGYASTAELTASLMANTQSNNPTAPSSYGTPANRIAKDGYSCDAVGASIASFTRNDTFRMFEFLGGGSGTGTVSSWQTAQGSHLLDDLGSCVIADVGYNANYAALSLEACDRWIHAGNAYWKSGDSQLPPISWQGFSSINLAWETYPAYFYYAGGTSQPLIPVFGFTDLNGDCWLRYYRSTSNASAYYDAAMGRHIYCRGRSIALAPNGGLIWGSCVMAVNGADRLVALVHHPADQPSDTTHNGFTRYLRVWWADIPTRSNGIRLDPALTICGIDPSDPWGWRGGILVDLGVMPPASAWQATGTPNSLKYASVWRFSQDGSKAVCLRDYGSLADYYPLGNTMWSAGLAPRAVELLFSVGAGQGAPLSVSVSFHDFTPGVNAPAKPVHHPGHPELDGIAPYDDNEVFGAGGLWETGVVPIAVDYDGSGNLIYAFAGSLSSYVQVPDPNHPGQMTWTGQLQNWNQLPGATTQTNPITTSLANQLIYVGTGPATTSYIIDLQNRILHGSVIRTPKLNRCPALAVVLDVASATFVLKITKPRFFTNLDNETGFLSPPSLNLSSTYQCTTFTGNAVNGVQLCSGGTVLFEDWYAANDGSLFEEPFDVCRRTSTDSSMAYLPLAASANVQGFYAQRFGATIYGYQCAPAPLAAQEFTSAPSTSECGCIYTVANLQATVGLPVTAQSPRGGRVVSTVPLPTNDWLIFAKVV